MEDDLRSLELDAGPLASTLCRLVLVLAFAVRRTAQGPIP